MKNNQIWVKKLTPQDALNAYATMVNTLEPCHLKKILADNFCYASQWVIEEIDTKDAYVDYITSKLKAIRKSDSPVWAELGWLSSERNDPCVVLAQGDRENLTATVLVRVKRQWLERIDVCFVPSPYSVIRSGVYPGLNCS